jgi:hypothetical protein
MNHTGVISGSAIKVGPTDLSGLDLVSELLSDRRRDAAAEDVG